MINSHRMRSAFIIFIAALAGIDAYAANNSPLGPALSQDLTQRPTATGSLAPQYRENPWLWGNAIPSIASLRNHSAGVWGHQTAPIPLPPVPVKQRSVRRKVFGAIVGAAGGFFAGAYLGAAIEGDCNCDDPGLRGAVIGGPIGAATGGVLGYKFLF